jgi:hypothetical protein
LAIDVLAVNLLLTKQSPDAGAGLLPVMAVDLESFAQYPPNQAAIIADLRPSYGLVADYRIKLGKSLRLRPGVEAKVGYAVWRS